MYQLIRGILKNPEDRTKITLVSGVNTEKDILLRPELEGLAERFPGRFEYLFTVSRPKGGRRLLRG
jgi:cytochrome-b5 reductase